MTNKSNKTVKRHGSWLILGFLSYVLAAPSLLVTKAMANEGIDPATYMVICAISVIAVLIVPATLYVLRHRDVIKRNKKSIVIACIAAGSCHMVRCLAAGAGQVSHVNVITLMSPILLVILSSWIVHERVDARAKAGVALAALGGVFVVAMPIISNGHLGFTGNIASTVLAALSCILSPIAMIYTRRANEGGVPLYVQLILWRIFDLILSIIIGPIVFGNTFVEVISGISALNFLIIAIYGGVVLLVALNIVHIKVYKKLGSAVTSSFQYLGTLLAIVLPIIILREKISFDLVIGAALIVFGIYLTKHGATIRSAKYKRLIKQRIYK